MKLASCLLWLPALLLAFPLAASATIYKWIDANGTTVYSNRAPSPEAKVSNVQVALEDDKPAAPTSDNGNELQNRIRALEQQVQALQGQASGYAAPPPPVSYYPPQDYYPPQSSYPSDYWSSMYGYGYPYYPAYSTIIVTGRRFLRPVHHGFVPHRVGVRPVPVAGVRSVPVAGVRSVPVSQPMGVSRAMGGSGRR